MSLHFLKCFFVIERGLSIMGVCLGCYSAGSGGVGGEPDMKEREWIWDQMA